MSISYDPNKNQSNIEKHGLDFEHVSDLDWDKAWIYEDERNEYKEQRYIAYSTLGRRLHLFVLQKQKMASVLFHFAKLMIER